MITATITGFADEIAPELSVQMDVLEQLGVHWIEMRGVDGKPLIEHTLDEVRDIRRRLDERGFKVSAVGSSLGKIRIDEPFGPHMELFRHTAEIAHILDTKLIRMFSFFIPEGDDPASWRDEVMARLSWMKAEAKRLGVILCHENEKGIYGDNAPRCLDIMQQLYDPECFVCVFDHANFIQVGQVPYPDAFDMLKDYILYMHIKDAKFADGSVVPAGMGDGRHQETLQALCDRNYKGFLSLEPHLGSFEGFAALEGAEKAAALPKGGPQLYAIALEALRKELSQLH